MPFLSPNQQCQSTEGYYFPSMLWHCWLGDRKGIRPVKSWVFMWSHFNWSFAYLYLQMSPPPIFVLSSNKIQNVVAANQGPPGKIAVKRRESPGAITVTLRRWHLNLILHARWRTALLPSWGPTGTYRRTTDMWRSTGPAVIMNGKGNCNITSIYTSMCH